MLPPIKIATPCPADWNKMAGDDKVRFCSLCNLNVYNLSAMSKTEALQVLQNHEGRLCARIYQRADGTVLTQDCPMGVRAAWKSMTRLATAVLAMIFVAPFARAQKIPLNPPEPIVVYEAKEKLIDVQVMNRLGETIRDAVVELQDKDLRIIASARTDRHGRAQLPRPVDGTYVLVAKAPLLMTYSRVLVMDQAGVVVKVDSYSVIMGVVASQFENSGIDLTPMPMHGIPDFQRNRPSSVN